MSARARELDALREVSHVTMNAEQLVAMAHPLSLRIDQEQDRPAGMLAHRFDDAFRHRERQLDADLGVVRRSENREDRVAAAPAARQQIAVRGDVVPAVEKSIGDARPIHATFYAARMRFDIAIKTSVASSGTLAGVSKPRSRQMSSPSACEPKRARRLSSICCSRSSVARERFSPLRSACANADRNAVC